MSFFYLLIKWQRFIFILIALEFMMMSLFYFFSMGVSEMMFFYFMCMGVISSILGLLVMIFSVKCYGNDMCIF
uniref:NADH dehydrogenase subunit 4L n=1 Tax=Ascaridia galli TaxID=46685 RepID=S4UCF3_9BILA|nr:NADH dehydrogenase subunit 4L [Ascaridia galli]AGI96018.1 NADH dehydrogenase subunit 4L [Ascaridia galli]WEB60581.1 NADH dehydrogenase subunit 4L [Ascaridia galli]